ncbi:MAG: cytochrome c-type biogenesis protein CcmH [Devosia sp.]|nr:cytochrome c-type biogenesis protein CcmH [Devosia sp.]
MKRLAGFLLAATLLLSPAASFAVNPDEMLADPVLEARAKAISLGLRCLVCQNQSIEDSDADLAHDLRVLVRERLKAGDTDAQVRQFIVGRYGEFVLLQPVFAPHTLVLWLAAPAMVLMGGGVLIWLSRRRRPEDEPQRLSAEEVEALESLASPSVEAADDLPPAN